MKKIITFAVLCAMISLGIPSAGAQTTAPLITQLTPQQKIALAQSISQFVVSLQQQVGILQSEEAQLQRHGRDLADITNQLNTARQMPMATDDQRTAVSQVLSGVSSKIGTMASSLTLMQQQRAQRMAILQQMGTQFQQLVALLSTQVTL